MKLATLPVNKLQRLGHLHDVGRQNTVREEGVDDLTGLTSKNCHKQNVPESFPDANRHWLKSVIASKVKEYNGAISCCPHRILQNPKFIARNKKFFNNSLVADGREFHFYAGMQHVCSIGSRLTARKDHIRSSLTPGKAGPLQCCISFAELAFSYALHRIVITMNCYYHAFKYRVRNVRAEKNWLGVNIFSL